MKVLYLNGADIEGGAAKAATRLLEGVQAQGADARLYVQRKYGDAPRVDGPRSLPGKVFGRVRPTIEQLISGITPGKLNAPFCSALLPDRLPGVVSGMAPDIVHLHWVARMMRLETLPALNRPIVWTMHDSWAFSGGCYLPGECTRYRESCGKCPVLGSAREDDLSRRIWQRKQKAWRDLNLTIIAPSRWMADSARASSLFRDRRIAVIPNGIDVQIYEPANKRAAREYLCLPLDKQLVLFGARGFTEDRNKGFHLLMQAMDILAGSTACNALELVIFGSPGAPLTTDLGIKIRSLGLLRDDVELARLYSAADVFVLPSLQENLPFTVMEAMACGTPCVAFNQGGVADLIDHLHNGYLAQAYEGADLARGIAWVLENDDRRKSLSLQARHKVQREFAVDKVAERHISLYRELLKHG